MTGIQASRNSAAIAFLIPGHHIATASRLDSSEKLCIPTLKELSPKYKCKGFLLAKKPLSSVSMAFLLCWQHFQYCSDGDKQQHDLGIGLKNSISKTLLNSLGQILQSVLIQNTSLTPIGALHEKELQ
ncbi:mitochondrial-processing peptidase subunit alpha [Platysternon megacephalum]|uniref:Mitochondrial-processing peptidase subunit alpha n=1 Tax=Platysternon megacephalum TaxID=55544 RepID=A0A4D9ESG0_9SAUR|nr:mitochondrial-processing peptidase subunit alpha [Platysternon megacephalum]